ncbi:ROK family protein [Candidatus Saccharibacteria bacterium]|nr:ROK family protein [Candidatus Saccharibacteria bacterium]
MYLTIDIGGTKTLIAAWTKHGRIVKKRRFKTPDRQSDFLALLETALIPFSVKYRTKITEVVVAVPGLIKDNIATQFGNRPWRNLDLAARLAHLFSCPITLENDANLATVYETSGRRGLGLYLTFSTGIGGGLARNGTLAKNSGSVEPGHTIYIYNNRSHEWEDIASCAALGLAYGCRATSIRGAAAYSDIAFRVALGLPELIQKYHPDYIVIGGPLAKLFPHFKPELSSNLHRILKGRALPRLIPARRPLESVIYGAYLYAKKLSKNSR